MQYTGSEREIQAFTKLKKKNSAGSWVTFEGFFSSVSLASSAAGCSSLAGTSPRRWRISCCSGSAACPGRLQGVYLSHMRRDSGRERQKVEKEEREGGRFVFADLGGGTSSSDRCSNPPSSSSSSSSSPSFSLVCCCCCCCCCATAASFSPCASAASSCFSLLSEGA